MIGHLLLAAYAAHFAPAAPGVCADAVEIPPEAEAWRVALYSPGVTAPPPAPAPALAAYRAAYLEARKKDWADVCRYRADNERLIALPAAERRVVFMGDSITEGWSYGDRSLFVRGWINRGISGQTTPQMLVRFPGDVLALKPAVVHIMAGTNDIAGNTGPVTLEMIQANLAAMATLAKANGIRVVMAATPPATKFVWLPDLAPAPRIAALNAWIKAYAAREGFEFVDYGTVWATAEGGMKPQFTFDGAHPNADGYVAIHKLAREAIERALH
ncbi:SGNH/GDSL hydrolase family protein [Sphingomonas sp. AOB5]|uniref:SGNH/GDSL hydrolase family protein n=1 Tax=Sphingomonas sp. AOB5 TaxID=3034017 RepID=UPI0023F6B906|nr:SGNH/GDSL hydrolase family protein [Sphingomonas sp. AOB5]MDF7775980.1 SGNH/GDSL hydrolase family protein [Sphingomonas sp. AOB5]